MTWKTPGGSNNQKDPWGGHNNQQKGPPDLDEVWRKFYTKLKNIFFGKSPTGPQSSSQKSVSNNAKQGIAVIVGIVIVLWFLSGIFIVDPAEKAVVVRFGRYVKTLDPGPHWIPRFIESKQIVDVSYMHHFAYGTSEKPIRMLTEDENIVSISITVQFRISNPRDFLFNVIDPQISLEQATASALRQVIGQSTLDDVLTVGREQIRQQVSAQLKKILQLYKTGIEVTDVRMQPATAPKEVKEAFSDAIRAQEDEQRFIKEAEAYARSVEPIAQGRASRMLQEAQAYKKQMILHALGEAERFAAVLPEYTRAPFVMRERLYLDAMESVLSRSSKVLVDTSGGNNVLYLPLEQLMNTVKSEAAAQAGQVTSVSNRSAERDNTLEELQATQGKMSEQSMNTWNAREQSLRELRQDRSSSQTREEE